MRKASSSGIIFLMLLFGSVFLLFTSPTVSALIWKLLGWDESDEGYVGITVDGKSELITSTGEPLKVGGYEQTFTGGGGGRLMDLSVLRLGVFKTTEGKVIQTLRITVDYSCQGQDVNWETLKVTLYATGTGINKNFEKKTQTGQFVIEIPTTTASLGLTPKNGEIVTFELTVYLEATISDVQGTQLKATTEKSKNYALLTYSEPNFTVSKTGTNLTPITQDDKDQIAQNYGGVVIGGPGGDRLVDLGIFLLTIIE
jgi:hypothetical protein